MIKKSIDERKKQKAEYDKKYYLSNKTRILERQRAHYAIVGNRNRSKVNNKNTCARKLKYTINHGAFDVMTESAMYWIGFLMADGNIGDRPGQDIIQLNLSTIDLAHIEKFKLFLGSNHKIYNKNNRASIAVSSQYMVDKLSMYGVVPRKSLIAEIIGLENSHHFWRGVVDGDGCIGIYGKHQAVLDLSGSRRLTQQFLNFVKTITNVNTSTKKRGNIYNVRIYGSHAIKVISNLYTDCTIALDRKYNKAIKMLMEYSLNG